jgi:hypothetical protein
MPPPPLFTNSWKRPGTGRDETDVPHGWHIVRYSSIGRTTPSAAKDGLLQRRVRASGALQPYSHASMVCRIVWLVVSSPGNEVRRIAVNWSSLKQTKPHEYAVRFLFGGLSTVAAALIAKHFGPGVGGLFLAFPAIFPASASLVESHEIKRKAKVGLDGRNRGRMAASPDSQGASLGCIGLVGFAFVLWKWVNSHNALLMISAAGMIWITVACGLWAIRAMRPRATHTTHRAVDSAP